MVSKLLRLRFRIIMIVMTCLTIMIADLIIVLINKYILSYNGNVGKHYITLIGMAAVLVIFYLMLRGINRVSEKFVEKFIHVTRVYLGRQIGLYISVSLIAILLFAGYYWAWFNNNLFYEVWVFIKSVPLLIKKLF